MSKTKRTTIAVKGASVAVLSENRQDFISLTDIARFKNPERSDDLVRNWLRNRNTVEFFGIWESLHNPDSNSVEFDGIRIQTGLNSFILTPKQWIEKTARRFNRFASLLIIRSSTPHPLPSFLITDDCSPGTTSSSHFPLHFNVQCSVPPFLRRGHCPSHEF